MGVVRLWNWGRFLSESLHNWNILFSIPEDLSNEQDNDVLLELLKV